MKKLIIPLLLLSLVGCNRSIYRSRVNPAYKPLSAFKSDTITTIGADTADYLKSNFILNKDKYIGKKFEFLVRDLRLNIYQITKEVYPFDRGHIESIEIYFYHFLLRRPNAVYYHINVEFENKLSSKEYEKIENKYPEWIWNKEKYTYFKNCIVKDIIMTDSRNWSEQSRKDFFK